MMSREPEQRHPEYLLVESTRTETCGVLASLTIINILEHLSSTTTLPIPVYCDNDEAVKRRSQHRSFKSFIKFVDTNYDVTTEIEDMIKSIKTEVQLIHLKGHQDDDKEFEYETAPLSFRMNIDMDASAKLFLKQNQKQLNPNRITPFYTASKIALCIHGNVISKNMEAHIKLHKNGPAVESRLMMKKIVAVEHMNWIQWRGLERAMQRLKTIAKIPISRIIHEKWSTESTIAEWHTECSGICLRCQLQQETHDHVYQCRSTNAKATMEKALKNFRASMKKCATVPMITELLVRIMKEYRMGYEICPTFTAYYSDQIKSLARSVYQKQRQLGPRNLVKGFMIQEWESLQNICVNNRSTAALNIEWSSKVISALWEFSKSIWDGRCARVHEPNSNGTKSLKSTELLRVLETEIAELRKTRLEYDSQQLLRNIDIKKDKAQNHTIYKWLNMLRHRKEEEKRRKQHDQTNRIRARPITNWCDRGRGT